MPDYIIKSDAKQTSTLGKVKVMVEQVVGAPSQEQIDAAVATYIEEHPGSISGLSEAAKAALLQLAEKAAYIDANGQTYYDDLYDAFYPPAELVGITAVYTQSGTVYDTDSLDSLKSDLVVTAIYSDSTTEVITSGYTLSGTLTEGTSTITVTYEGKTATFTVTVSHNAREWTDGVPYSFEWVENAYIENRSPGGQKPYNGWKASPYLNCAGAGHLQIHNGFGTTTGYNAWYDENKTWINKFTVTVTATTGTVSIAVPSNAVYFRVSYDTSGTAGDKTYTITPTEA